MMREEEEDESKIGAQTWQSLSQGKKVFFRDKLLQTRQDIWNPLIMLQETVSKEEQPM